jgi:hypothetical protein
MEPAIAFPLPPKRVVGQVEQIYGCSDSTKISEEGIRRSALVIWRVAPARNEIRSESPENRERQARFRLARERCAKFVEHPVESGFLR